MLFSTGRISTNFRVLPLLGNEVIFSAIHLFNFSIGLRGRAPTSGLGLRFIVSTFTDGSAMGGRSGVSLHFGSVLVHQKGFHCSIGGTTAAPKGFGTGRVSVHGVDTGVSVGTFGGSDLGTGVGGVDFSRTSNFSLGGLSLGVMTGGSDTVVGGFRVGLPRASLGVSHTRVRAKRTIDTSSLLSRSPIRLGVTPSRVYLGSLSTFIPTFHGFSRAVRLSTRTSNCVGGVNLGQLALGCDSGVLFINGVRVGKVARPRSTCVFKRIGGVCVAARKVSNLTGGFGRHPIGLPSTVIGLNAVGFAKRVSNFFSGLITFNGFSSTVNSIRASLVFKGSGRGGVTTCLGKRLSASPLRLGRLFPSNGPCKATGLTIALSARHPTGKSFSNGVGTGVSRFRCGNCGCRGVLLSNGFRGGKFGKILSVGSPGNGLCTRKLFLRRNGGSVFGFASHLRRFRPSDLRLAGGCRTPSVSYALGTSFAKGGVSGLRKDVALSDLSFGAGPSDFFLGGFGMRTAKRSLSHRLTVASSILGNRIANTCSFAAVIPDLVRALGKCVPTLVGIARGGRGIVRGGFSLLLAVRGARTVSGALGLPFAVLARKHVAKRCGGLCGHFHFRTCLPGFGVNGSVFRSNCLAYSGPRSEMGLGLGTAGCGTGKLHGCVSLGTSTGSGQVRARVD